MPDTGVSCVCTLTHHLKYRYIVPPLSMYLFIIYFVSLVRVGHNVRLIGLIPWALDKGTRVMLFHLASQLPMNCIRYKVYRKKVWGNLCLIVLSKFLKIFLVEITGTNLMKVCQNWLYYSTHDPLVIYKTLLGT